jgi:hypothetical protein
VDRGHLGLPEMMHDHASIQGALNDRGVPLHRFPELGNPFLRDLNATTSGNCNKHEESQPETSTHDGPASDENSLSDSA